jgi:hypothetical protein
VSSVTRDIHRQLTDVVSNSPGLSVEREKDKRLLVKWDNVIKRGRGRTQSIDRQGPGSTPLFLVQLVNDKGDLRPYSNLALSGA